jgi:hypothetical protein
MAFASFSSGPVGQTFAFGVAAPDNPKVLSKKIGQLVIFPNITGRDAPGKTGNFAKPALISDLTFYINEGPAKVRYAIWESNGTNPVFTSEYSPVSGFDKLAIVRSVFSGTQYRIGFALAESTSTSTGLVSSALGPGQVTYNTTQWQDSVSSTWNFFSNGLAFNGSLAYSVFYDVLPTEPLNLSTTLVTPSNPAVQLDWDAVASDGGQAVSGYRVQISTDNVTWTTLVANTGSTDRTYTTSELVFGATYYFRVAAINLVATSAGSDYSGPYSASATATIAGAAPGNAQSFLTATVANPEPLPIQFTDFGNGIRFTAIDVQYGSEFLYNEITATTQDSFAELQTTEAPQSKALYGVRTYSVSNLLNSTDFGALEVAKDYLTYYYQPELRVQSITVDLSNLTTQEKLQVLNLEIDSYISVSFTPNGVGDPKIASGLVTGISHRISITTHEVELRLRNERNLFTLDSDSKGILDVNILGP